MCVAHLDCVAHFEGVEVLGHGPARVGGCSKIYLGGGGGGPGSRPIHDKVQGPGSRSSHARVQGLGLAISQGSGSRPSHARVEGPGSRPSHARVQASGSRPSHVRHQGLGQAMPGCGVTAVLSLVQGVAPPLTHTHLMSRSTMPPPSHTHTPNEQVHYAPPPSRTHTLMSRSTMPRSSSEEMGVYVRVRVSPPTAARTNTCWPHGRPSLCWGWWGRGKGGRGGSGEGGGCAQHTTDRPGFHGACHAADINNKLVT